MMHIERDTLSETMLHDPDTMEFRCSGARRRLHLIP
jgi:hypothetical protein